MLSGKRKRYHLRLRTDGRIPCLALENLRLVRCNINGTQPLCYCRRLKVEDCEFGPECDLAFEDSDVEATVRTAIVSVKNPRSGSIKALAIGETIKDANILAPADCKIETKL